MNKNTVIGIVVIIIVIIAGYFLLRAPAASAPADEGALKPAEAAPSGTSNSDAALDKDSAAIDAQMKGFDADNASVDGSMNDTPVSQ